MAAGTRRTASTSGRSDPRRAETGRLTHGAFVEVSVRDTGCGVDPVAQGRIFEPLFTTKDRGHGPGLVPAPASGAQALEIFRSNPRRIDAVILDMVMAGMGGGETFDRLREIDPGTGVLLSSGYSIDSQVREILARGCEDFVQKPYGPDVLSQKLRAVIEKRGRARRTA